MADAADSAAPTVFRMMDLPNEIIREICCHPELQRTELRALRLTCKHLCEFASQRLAKRYFRAITVSLSRPSLRALIELAQHPYFGPAVEIVNISAIYDASRVSHAVQLPGAAGINDAGHAVVEVYTIEILNTCLTKFRKERMVMTDGSTERMLSIAFKAFAQREQRLQLQISNREFYPIGPRDLLRDKTFRDHLMWHLDWQTTFEQTIRAATIHDCKITSLTIDTPPRERFLNSSGLRADDLEQHLSCLCSDLAHFEFIAHGLETTTGMFERVVTTAKNLESLTLWMEDKWEHRERRMISGMLKCVASTSLKTITLAEFRMSEPDLLEFLGRQKDTLRELTLMDGCLVTGSSMSLVAWIKDNMPRLEYLYLGDVCESLDHTNCSDSEAKSYDIGQGDDMQACLADILDGKYEKAVKVEDADATEQNDEDTESEQAKEDNKSEQVEEMNEPE